MEPVEEEKSVEVFEASDRIVGAARAGQEAARAWSANRGGGAGRPWDRITIADRNTFCAAVVQADKGCRMLDICRGICGAREYAALSHVDKAKFVLFLKVAKAALEVHDDVDSNRPSFRV